MFYADILINVVYFRSDYVVLIYNRTLQVKYIPESTDQTSLIFLHLFVGICQVHIIR